MEKVESDVEITETDSVTSTSIYVDEHEQFQEKKKKVMPYRTNRRIRPKKQEAKSKKSRVFTDFLLALVLTILSSLFLTSAAILFKINTDSLLAS